MCISVISYEHDHLSSSLVGNLNEDTCREFFVAEEACQ